jgi:hypothetical protein
MDISHSFLGSPMAQIWSEEDEERLGWYPGSFSRKANWLEESTEDVLNIEKLPLGTLTEEDVESITGLMAAWVRRRSLEAALSVEKLLKRVVDDLRAGNTDIRVTARMYTIVSSKMRYHGKYPIWLLSHSDDTIYRRSMHGQKVGRVKVPNGLNKFTMV